MKLLQPALYSTFSTCVVFAMALCVAQGASAQLPHAPEASSATSTVHLRLDWPPGSRPASAVLWLEAQPGTPAPKLIPRDHYALLQKNRTFLPHLQVVPVGTAVAFPNADPFFHNVFSLFDGKRFDLGLYEAGSTKSVTFSREGISYIFCDIHPEMSAVVVALSSPLYAIAGSDSSFSVEGVPQGNYTLHLWVEGMPLPWLESQSRAVHISSRTVNLGSVTVPSPAQQGQPHSDKFGRPYAPDSKPAY